MAKEFIITEGDIDRELDALVEVRRDKDSQASEVKALVQQLGLVPGDIKQLDRIPGLTKKSSFLAVNKDGIGRVYSVDSNPTAAISGGKGQAIDWAGKDGRFVDDEEADDDKGEKAEIIIPDLESSSGGARFIGGLSSVGDPITKQIRDFIEDFPFIGDWHSQFSTLIKVFATIKMIQAAGGALQEALSAEMLKDIENQFKTYLKGPVTKAFKDAVKKDTPIEATQEFDKFVAGEIKKLKAVKAQVDQSASLSKAYNKTTNYGDLTDKLMIKMLNILKNSLGELADSLPEKEEPEEEESVTEPTEPTGTGRPPTLIPVNEDKLTEIVIDFNEIRKNELNESFLTMFGSWIKHILGAMLGGFNIPVSVRGSKNEVESFARAVGSEKSYIETAKRYGLDHPTTYKSQAKLRTATKGFEKETGIKWPFK
tara:strand:+ start:374 stop:1651 length:1278 start_codon:yes stop_codon:yes gene_type:complete